MPPRSAGAVLLLLAAPGCVPPASGDVGADQQPIVGGATVAACGWPSVVLAASCSGTLVHPRVVVTAAHCVQEGITQIDFGEMDGRLARSVPVSRCTAHPSYRGNTDDIGVCVLSADVTGVPIVPLMAACEASLLRAGAAVTEVGFGQSVARTGPSDGFGVKRWMAATIRTVATTRGQIDVTTGTQDGEYYGDSGGPLFFQMSDGTWRVIGTDSSSPDIIPGSSAARVSTYTSVPSHVAWLETTSGIDLTACHDAAGWSPTAACAGLPTNPADGVGTWSALCAGQTLVTPQATCGGVSTGGAGGAGAGGAGASGASGAGAGGAGASGAAGAGAGRAGTGGGTADAGPTGSGGAASDGAADGGRDGGRDGDGDGGGSGSGGSPGTGGAVDAGGAGATTATHPPGGCACAIAPESGAASDSTVLALFFVFIVAWTVRFRSLRAINTE